MLIEGTVARTRGLRGLICAGLFLLSGCGAEYAPQVGVRLAQADLAYGPAALDRGVADFLGPPAVDSPAGDGLFGGNGTAGTPKARADVDYRAIKGQEAALALALRQPLTENWQLEGGVRVGQGRANYVLPAGSLRLPVGSFSVIIGEDVTLRATNRFVEADALALRRVAIPFAGALDLGAGVGLRATDSRLNVSTQTLFPIEIDSSHRQIQPYAALQARYTLPRVPARMFVEGRIYGRRAAGLRAGLDVAMPLTRVR